MFDLKNFRSQFPIFDQKIHGHPLAYLDNAATTQKPQVVLEAIQNYYTKQNANVHRGVHQLSELATDAYEKARLTVARFINASCPEEIIFTSGTTESINLVASNFGPQHSVAFSDLEHHANIVPWQQTGAEITVFDPANPELPADLDLLAITGMSNVTGEKPDLSRILKSIQSDEIQGNKERLPEPYQSVRRQRSDAVDAEDRSLNRFPLKLIDAAQLVAHESIDVQKLGCDFLAFSGHKILGPTGIGVLYAKKEQLEKMHPYQTGGGMIKVVNEKTSTFAEIPAKFEAGTPNIEGAIALAAAIEFIQQIDHQAAHTHLQNLITQTHKILSKYPEIQPHSAPDSPIISFTTTSAHPHDIASILDQEGVAIRAGHHCCQLLMRKLQAPATSRISLYYYNNKEDLEQLDRGLQKVFATFNS